MGTSPLASVDAPRLNRRTSAPAFDRARSLQLDTILIQLDTQPHGARRLLLRMRKALIEQRIPAYPCATGARSEMPV